MEEIGRLNKEKDQLQIQLRDVVRILKDNQAIKNKEYINIYIQLLK